MSTLSGLAERFADAFGLKRNQQTNKMKQQLYRILDDKETTQEGDIDCAAQLNCKPGMPVLCYDSYVLRPVAAPHWVAFSERGPQESDYRNFGGAGQELVVQRRFYGISYKILTDTLDAKFTHWLCDLYPPEDKPSDDGFDKWYEEWKACFSNISQARTCYNATIAAAKTATSPEQE